MIVTALCQLLYRVFDVAPLSGVEAEKQGPAER